MIGYPNSAKAVKDDKKVYDLFANTNTTPPECNFKQMQTEHLLSWGIFFVV